jgi:sulfite exporter TauE/SafE
MFAILSGFLAGCIHVFSGPDHLAAVAPLSVGRRRRAWQLGVRWGLGHASGVLVLGALSLLLRNALPLASISSWTERLVGVVLIGIGIWGLRKALTQHLHTHEHEHNGHAHLHIHLHTHKTAHPDSEPASHVHPHAAFAVGSLHGLAGSSHLFGILPALAFGQSSQALGYLGAYGVGTILAMAAFSSMVGWLASGLKTRGNRAYRALMVGCSTAAMVIGGFWLLG